MPEDRLELEVENGVIRSIYKDDIHPLLDGMGSTTVARASNVEWEDVGLDRGWTVRSASKPYLALRLNCGRIIVSEEGPLVFFNTREEALKEEINHFWELLPPRSMKEK
jgi:hypothetical protein